MSDLKIVEEDLERDFFKEDEKRASFEELIIGQDLPTREVELTENVIQYFAEMIEDLNPLYFDAEYAKKSTYGGLISPITIHTPLLFLCTPLSDICKATGVINAGQFWYYYNPARPGDKISLRRMIYDKYVRKNRLWIYHYNIFSNQKKEIICAGGGWRIHSR